jgi:hypothetical protein
MKNEQKCADIPDSQNVPLTPKYEFLKCKQTGTISVTMQALTHFTSRHSGIKIILSWLHLKVNLYKNDVFQ